MRFFYRGLERSVDEMKMLHQISGNGVPLKFDELANLDISYKGSPIESHCLEIRPDGLVVQLMLEETVAFDKMSNCYQTSEIRRHLSSLKFLDSFNREFISHVKESEVHTEDYITRDRFYLLSHEEVGVIDGIYRFKPNREIKRLDMFSDCVSRQRVVGDKYVYWWLRSASAGTDIGVGCVCDNGRVSNYHITSDIKCLPACLIA